MKKETAQTARILLDLISQVEKILKEKNLIKLKRRVDQTFSSSIFHVFLLQQTEQRNNEILVSTQWWLDKLESMLSKLSDETNEATVAEIEQIYQLNGTHLLETKKEEYKYICPLSEISDGTFKFGVSTDEHDECDDCEIYKECLLEKQKREKTK